MSTNTLDSGNIVEMDFYSKTVLSFFKNVEYGSIQIELPSGAHFIGKGEKDGPEAKLKVYDWFFFERVFKTGDIGFGESYINTMWSSDNIAGIIEFALKNEKNMKNAIYGQIHKLILYKLKHLFNRNTKSGSQKNIHAHYDIGNEFYFEWLDETRSYSSALFNSQEDDLITAQQNKYNTILDELGVQSGDKLLEIGCGWGGMIRAASKRGIKVTGVTISREQFNHCEKIIQEENLLGEVSYKDYRDLHGEFDYIVSIEMFEALGKEYWDIYFKQIERLLSNKGKAIIQTITINNKAFKAYSRGTDFIQQYIFPGGMLPSPDVFLAKAKRQKLKGIELRSFGLDYARTLNLWNVKFQQIWPSLNKKKFDPGFKRLWEFYFKYCEGAFLAGKTDVNHFLLEKT